jgi:ribonuclease HI
VVLLNARKLRHYFDDHKFIVVTGFPIGDILRNNPESIEVWKMYFDGSLKLQGVGAGILLITPGGELLKYALQLLFPASNNIAESEALIHGLNIAVSLGIKRLMVYEDSLVIISHVNKDWDGSTDSTGNYCTAVRKIEDKFEG